MVTRPSPFSLDLPEVSHTRSHLALVGFFFLFKSLPPFARGPFHREVALSQPALPRSLGSQPLMDHTVAPSAFSVGLNGVLCWFVRPQINGAAHRFISCSPPLSKLTGCHTHCCLLLFSFPDF